MKRNPQEFSPVSFITAFEARTTTNTTIFLLLYHNCQILLFLQTIISILTFFTITLFLFPSNVGPPPKESMYA